MNVHTPELRLQLLDGFELRRDGATVLVPVSAQRVIAFLGLKPGRLARVFVAGHLWADVSEERAAAALRTALWRIGRLGSRLVVADAQSLRLSPEVEVDVLDSTRVARQILEEPGGELPAAAWRALRERSELLPDWYDDWVLVERERHRQLRLHALERACERLSAAGRHAEATEAGVVAVAAEPLRESAHRALIAAHLAEGNVFEALRQYDRCSLLLRRDLDAAPSPALESLVAPLRRFRDDRSRHGMSRRSVTRS
jgi:DNA-binding SARP family transcriptional activator